MSSCLDLRTLQNSQEVADVYSLLVSGKKGYKAVIERKKEPIRCTNDDCRLILEGNEKFCPECGTKTCFCVK